MTEGNFSMPNTDVSTNNKIRYKETQKVTLTGIIVNIFLSIAQLSVEGTV